MITRIGATPTVSRQNISNRKNNPNFGILMSEKDKASVEAVNNSDVMKVRQFWRMGVYFDDGHGPQNLKTVKSIVDKVQATRGTIPHVLETLVKAVKEESAKVGLRY